MLNMDNDNNNDTISANDDHSDEDEQDATPEFISTTKRDLLGVKVFDTMRPYHATFLF